jgi:hypothetical protein
VAVAMAVVEGEGKAWRGPFKSSREMCSPTPRYQLLLPCNENLKTYGYKYHNSIIIKISFIFISVGLYFF